MQATLRKAKNNYDGHLSALTSALVEFQKAQCFFAVTLQIAALIVIPPYFNGMHEQDQILLRLTAANGFSPIVLTLAHIDFLGGRNSWYLLFLSGVTFTLGTATYWSTSPSLTGGPINWQTTYQNPIAPLSSCGNVSPFAPCFVRNQFQDYNLWPKFQGVSWYTLTDTVGLVVWVICLGIFLYRVTYKICHIRNNWERISKHLTILRTDYKASFQAMVAKVQSYKQGARIVSVCGRFSATLRLPQISGTMAHVASQSKSWDYAQLVLGYLGLIAQLISVIIVLASSTSLIATQMTFGQIVAVGIWVPVFLEYAYLEISKQILLRAGEWMY
ncbi:uncharacterized protein LY89DRAFT_229914 [Mollisia scopiformis]|uniref:Uncharacterized protein n=1 Tax=Mollisia scopiformis TaxID=149040 RepID=A0A194WUQ0_MOLSC|nr:uncharacterized protein LY89DRAFT_229914 [Mollisia scopiformis]KUJ11691.1 hypothetical protein LY89DRAFT_229914 [Mollisia scopiformis]